MEIKIQNGDYVPDGLGGVVRCQGTDALLERVLFRLTAITDVILTPEGQGRIGIQVLLEYQGTDLSVSLAV